MTAELMQKWYDEVFLPRALVLGAGRPVLLLDRFSGQVRLNPRDPSITIRLLPAGSTPVLQPLDRGILSDIKRLYKVSCLWLR